MEVLNKKIIGKYDEKSKEIKKKIPKLKAASA